MSDIRKDFEALALLRGYSTDKLGLGNEYVSDQTNILFEGYQAGRAHDVDSLSGFVEKMRL